jgi:potassium/hydrogen antiporter
LAGIEKADMIFNIVFFISVTFVLIQGTTLTIVAKWLNVALPEKVKPLSEIEKFISEIPKSMMQEFEILPDYYAVNKRIVDLNIPKSAFIIMINRNGEYISPGGSTEIEAKDVLIVLGDNQEDFDKVKDCLSRPDNVIKT